MYAGVYRLAAQCGIRPDQADEMVVWKLAMACGMADQPDDRLPDGSINPWGDSKEAKAEMIRLRMEGLPIPDPPPPTDFDDF